MDRVPSHGVGVGSWPRLVASVIGGLLLTLAFPPYDIAPLAFVALIPLLWAWRDASPKWAAAYGFAFGFAFFASLMYWFAFFGVLAFILVPAVCAAFVALTGVLVACFARVGVRSPWIVGAAWVVPEALRGRWPLGGLPWGELGTASARRARRACARRRRRGRARLVPARRDECAAPRSRVRGASGRTAPARAPRRSRSAAWCSRVSSSTRRVSSRIRPASCRVALLQGNDQNRDIPVASAAFVPITENHFELAESLEGNYDLIVFPESALYADPEADAILGDRVRELGAAHDAAVLVNAAVDQADDDRALNVNFLYAPDGALLGSYAKRNLVPFGEYLPARGLLDRLRIDIPIDRDYEPGDSRELFSVAGRRLGTMICFESAFASVSRALRARRCRAPRADDEQPLVPAFGQQRAARRAESDARGRDGPAGAARIDLRRECDHRRGRARR